MRVVAMFRVSTERQAEEGASLDAQERRYRELAKANHWKTVGEFRGCESATQAATERHVLQQVLACIREQQPDALYVHEQSRLTRGDELEVALLFRELRERGLKIIVGGIIRDLSSIDERFMVGIQSLVDRAEADRMRERSRRGKREKARQGKKNTAAAPFGYMNPSKGDPKRGTLQVVPERAAIVQRIFELAASGMGKYAIAKALNAEGHRPPKSAQWGPTSVQHILENPAYIGIHASNVWVLPKGSRTHYLDLKNPDAIVVENAHQAIISRKLWDAVHSRPRLPTTRKPNLLTGLLHVQGQPYSGDSTHNRSYYRSPAEHGRPWLRVQATNEAVWKAFVAMACEPRLVECLMSESERHQRRVNGSATLRHLQALASKLESKLDRLVDMRADGEITKDVYMVKSEQARHQLASAKARLAAMQAEAAAPNENHIERVVKALRSLISNPRKITDQQKRQVLTSIVRRINLSVQRQSQRRAPHGRFARANSYWAITKATFDLATPSSDRVGHLDRRSSSSEVRSG